MSLAFRARHRRRMMRARWIGRAALFGFIPLLMLIDSQSDGSPKWLVPAFQWAHALTLLGLPLFGVLQHPITSLVTKAAIESGLKHRMTTRFTPAVTPVASRLGAFAKKLLITAFAIEVAIMLFHALGPRDELAQRMRVLYGRQSGNEGWLAQFTGSLTWMCQLSILGGALLLILDRRNKRVAARAEAGEAARQSAPLTLLT